MPEYDEGRLATALRQLDKRSRTAFAAACAERLWPLVERYAEVISMPLESAQELRQSLDAAWSAARGDDAGLVAAQEAAESMVPHEDGDWVWETGYAQNAIAAIAYATRAWLTDDPQEAVWAARQVYEAADYAAQHRDMSARPVRTGDVEEHLPNSTAVQATAQAILADLEAVTTNTVESVRQRVRAESHPSARLFP